MAESVGSKFKSVLILILIGLLTIGLLLFAVTDAFKPSQTNAVVTAGDYAVDGRAFKNEFVRQLDQQNQQAESQGGQRMNSIQAYKAGLGRRILSESGQQVLVKADADDLGVGVNRYTVRNLLESIPAFTNSITGEYEDKKVVDYLRRSPGDETLEEFEDRVIYDLKRGQAFPAIVAGVEAPNTYSETQFRFIYETRKIDVLTLGADAVETPEDPGDDALKSYIAANANRYTAPEYRAFTMLRAEYTDFVRDVEISEDDIQNEFELRRDSGQLGDDETRSYTAITAPTEALAEKAADALRADDAPGDIILTLGLEAPDVYENATEAQAYDPEVGKAAFEMTNGDTKVIQGSLGSFVAVQVNAVNASDIATLEEARDAIEQDIRIQLSKDSLYDLQDQVQDALRDGDTIEEVGVKLGLSVSSMDFVDRLGRTQDGLSVRGEIFPGVGADEEIMTVIFTEDIDYASDIFETATGGMSIVRVDEIVDSQLSPFDEIRTIALSDWQQEQVKTAISELADSVQIRADGGETLTAIAESIGDGAEVTQQTAIRANRNENLGDLILVRIYDGKVGEIVRGPGRDGTSQQIGKLVEILPNNDTLSGRIADQLGAQVSAGISRDLILSYQTQIINQHGYEEKSETAEIIMGVRDEAAIE